MTEAPGGPQVIDRRLIVLALAAGAALVAAAVMIFVYAPTDALQGDVQRIFYFHVASAVGAYLCFALVLGGGIVHLLRGRPAADRLAQCAAEVGLLFTTVVLVMGSLWAKPIWGTFWTWDARLTSTLALWIIYAVYQVVRRLAANPAAAARRAAWVGVIGFVDVPIVHMSVLWWRTLHPQPVIDNARGPQLPPEMMITFLVTLGAVLLLASTLVTLRYRLELLRVGLGAAHVERVAASAPAEGGRLVNNPLVKPR